LIINQDDIDEIFTADYGDCGHISPSPAFAVDVSQIDGKIQLWVRLTPCSRFAFFKGFQ
jgi:hypothetical protein